MIRGATKDLAAPAGVRHEKADGAMKSSFTFNR